MKKMFRLKTVTYPQNSTGFSKNLSIFSPLFAASKRKVGKKEKRKEVAVVVVYFTDITEKHQTIFAQLTDVLAVKYLYIINLELGLGKIHVQVSL